MSPRLPPCAWCGASLARRDYILVDFRGLPGKPRVGWHQGCAGDDPAWHDHRNAHDAYALLEAAADRAANGYPGAPHA